MLKAEASDSSSTSDIIHQKKLDSPRDISTTSPCTLGTCDFIYDVLFCTNFGMSRHIRLNNFWITQGTLAPHHHEPWAPLILSMVPCFVQNLQLMMFWVRHVSPHQPLYFLDNPGGISATSPCTLGTCDFIYGALYLTKFAASYFFWVRHVFTHPPK